MNPEIFVIVPAYNEEQIIRTTLQSLLTTSYSIIVVDDGSTDRTWSLATRFPVYALRHPLNLGQGAALQTGMDFALQQGADIIVHFDADGQHQVKDVETMIAPLQAGLADVTLGSRFLRAEDQQAIPMLRRWVLKGGIVVNGLITGVWLSDAHNGLRALTRQAAQKIQLKENRYAYASEILSQIQQANLRYLERPTSILYSDYSMAKGQSSWNAFNILIDLLLRRIFQ